MEAHLRAVFLYFILAACAAAQSDMRNTVTFSGGFAHNAGNSCCGDSAPSLAVTYAYRLFPHVDLEAGVDTAYRLEPKPGARATTSKPMTVSSGCRSA